MHFMTWLRTLLKFPGFRRRPAIERPARLVGQVIRAKGDNSPIRADCVNATVAQPIQVEVPRILEGHARYAESMRPGAR